jgi:hypothetical protein
MPVIDGQATLPMAGRSTKMPEPVAAFPVIENKAACEGAPTNSAPTAVTSVRLTFRSVLMA